MNTSFVLIAAALFASPSAVSAVSAPAPVVTPVVASAIESEATVAAFANCTYYNNAAHTTVVGQFGRDCCNNNVAWGIKTQFSVCGGCFPCIPPPP